MSTVDDRAQNILAWLLANQGRRGVRRHTMLAELGLSPGSKTDQAMKRAWQMATAIGMHFPSACYSNGWEMHVTTDPVEAIRPLAQLLAIANGVLTRAGDAAEFLNARSAELSAEQAAQVVHLIRRHRQAQGATTGMLEIAREMATAVNGRRSA